MIFDGSFSSRETFEMFGFLRYLRSCFSQQEYRMSLVDDAEQWADDEEDV